MTKIEIIFGIITALIVCGFLYLVIKYANTPVTEMPMWVWFLLKGGRK